MLGSWRVLNKREWTLVGFPGIAGRTGIVVWVWNHFYCSIARALKAKTSLWFQMLLLWARPLYFTSFQILNDVFVVRWFLNYPLCPHYGPLEAFPSFITINKFFFSFFFFFDCLDWVVFLDVGISKYFVILFFRKVSAGNWYMDVCAVPSI